MSDETQVWVLRIGVETGRLTIAGVYAEKDDARQALDEWMEYHPADADDFAVDETLSGDIVVSHEMGHHATLQMEELK